MIRVEGLVKRYGERVAVDGVSFEVRPNETFGLLGPNGAGKTTTLMLLIGALRADAGRIRVDGVTDPTRADVRHRVGIAPQTLSLYERFTAEENLAFFGRLYGLSGRTLRERVAAALEQVELTDRRRDRVETYSGGMKRRLNLACALVHAPRVLLLDEPTIGVDPQSRHHLLTEIEALKRQGRTILYTTHYMEEAQRLCDRVAIMDEGRILALDTVSGLLERHGGRPVLEAQLLRPPADPASLPGRVDGSSLFLETDSPFEDIKRLAVSGEPIRTLHVHRPDLETVFLSLTGKRLRD